MIQVLTLALLLGGIPLALGGPGPVQASGQNGSAYAWGANFYGQLGNGTTANQTTPAAVSLQSGVRATDVAAGGTHILTNGSDGKLYASGLNNYGQLGDGTGNRGTTPVLVHLPIGVTTTTVAAGGSHSLVLGSDGNVYASGSNSNGQLGDGTTYGSNSPVVVHLPSGVHATAIAAGDYHSLAIGSDGHVYAWGYNTNGQLGNGTNTNSDVPVQVGLPAGVTPTAVAGEASASLTLGSDGKVYSWGSNDHGGLGAAGGDSNVPVLVDLPVGATAIGAGQSHGLAIGSNGKLYAWGLNDNGELGVYTGNNDNYIPVVAGIPSGTTPLALGTGPKAYHSLAILSGSGGPTAALVLRFRVAHTDHGVVFHWHVAATTGILGFSLTAGPRYLNRTLIPVHAGSQSYHYATPARVPGPYTLHVVLRDGGSIAIAIAGS